MKHPIRKKSNKLRCNCNCQTCKSAKVLPLLLEIKQKVLRVKEATSEILAGTRHVITELTAFRELLINHNEGANEAIDKLKQNINHLDDKIMEFQSLNSRR